MASLNTFAWGRWLKWPFMAVVALVGLSLVTAIYTAGQPLWAMLVLALVSLGCYVYLSKPTQAYRYLFPGLAAMLVFVAFPLVYTAQIGFTNYSSTNLLSQERVLFNKPPTFNKGMQTSRTLLNKCSSPSSH